MFEGWQQAEFDEISIRRTLTFILGDIVNRSAGGKGVIKQMTKIMPLPGDTSSEDEAMKKLNKRLKQQEQRNGKDKS